MLKCLIYVSVTVLFMVSCGSAAQQQYKSHAVQKGETVYSIAKKYNISEETIYNLNPDSRNELKVNSVLIIPSSSVISSGTNNNNYRDHKVKKKETLYGIAQLYNVSVDDIKKLNKELYSRGLRKGERLLIPAASNNTGNTNTNIGNTLPGTQQYTVKAKETKFGIARKFGISIAELEDLNPDLGESLKVGTTLVVPDKAVIENAEIDEENFQYYEVKPKEGYYRLKVKFGLSEEEIIALNPYAKDGLKDGMILKLPKDETAISQADISVIDLEKRIENKKMKTVALMLPFRLMRNVNDSTSNDQDLLKKDPTLRVALDFYSGALLAAEFAKDNGISVTLNVYDTEKSDSKVASIISRNEFKNVDAVIGPLLQKNVEKASAMLKGEKIPVFSPLSNREMAMNDNLFQTLPTDAVLQKTMIRYLKENSAGKNIIIISDSKRVKQKEMIQTAIPTAKTVSPRGSGYIQASDITAVASEGMENWVILESENPILVSSAVNVLSAMPNNYKMRLFTLNKNDAYEWHEVSSMRLAKLNFTFPSVNKNINPEDRIPFLISYKNKYGVLPNRYAIRGFDVTYDVLLRLASEKDIYDAILPESETVYIENKFRYEKSKTEGYCNEAAYILKYNDELKFDVVE
ncbi:MULTISPECIES: LysM peptidoglycan-binding domain-containing protein [Aequorivita]|uniref:LysM peptidoglycan-binding domain-containing protein n=1 Tax=Aequorivita iocasae TaxID=2803865 RepID=A0ABX7DNJ3_9FLAO|nr:MULTISPECIES: LysM peptidoglycan-binding domain-containing protein [Aequorivita]QQX75643.1 LysM peptidoglycan-binding domain-containing protein [Aequorivita iocasae]UCA55099.1 LysM peptidoglycan-binding domain-containing protein [Aequorivita sp. F7]